MIEIYVIEDPDELMGKTVHYIELNRFSIPAILVTTDGGIMLWETSPEEETMSEEIEIDVYSRNRVEARIFNDNRLIARIMKCGILQQEDFDKFLAGQKEQRRKEQEDWQLKQDQKDREDFERLKNKFERKMDEG